MSTSDKGYVGATYTMALHEPEERGTVLDALEARAIEQKRLVRQRPGELGVYDESDGAAFHATPVIVDPEALAARKAKHAANGQGEPATKAAPVRKATYRPISVR
jgi:hypothetical protein